MIDACVLALRPVQNERGVTPLGVAVGFNRQPLVGGAVAGWLIGGSGCGPATASLLVGPAREVHRAQGRRSLHTPQHPFRPLHAAMRSSTIHMLWCAVFMYY